jgi:glycosyltransferase involved in cell wall biosynthesis
MENRLASRDVKNFTSMPLFDENTLLKPDASYPKISVVIPSYNKAKYIERTVLSILNQNYPNLELLVIDGCSTDGSLEIIRKFERFISFFVNERDDGQTSAINKGIKMATGQLVAWQNADDLYLPGAFAAVVRMYEMNPLCDLFSGNALVIDADDNIVQQTKFIRPTRRRLLLEGYIMTSQAVFWKRSLHEEFGYFREDYHMAMDYDFWIRCLERARSAYTDQRLGAFRSYGETKTAMMGNTVGADEVNEIQRCAGIDPAALRIRLLRWCYRVFRLARYILIRELSRI